MFASFVKLLFPSLKKNQKPDYLYFENNKVTQDEEQMHERAQWENALHEPLTLTNERQASQLAFYHFCFGEAGDTALTDELSNYISQEIGTLLAQPERLLNALPAIPMSISKILAKITTDDFDTREITEMVSKEPVIAAKVIELANSSFYNPKGIDIVDIKKAFMLLGQNGLIQGVLTGFIAKFSPQPDAYFKSYGRLIWQHSQSTGEIAVNLLKSANHHELANQGYLLGLISNLGEMIIYQLLLTSFTYLHPDNSPSSYAFKYVMYKEAHKLTMALAKFWQFPTSIIDALQVRERLLTGKITHEVLRNKPLAVYVEEADILSQLIMRLDAGALSLEAAQKEGHALLISEQSLTYLSSLSEEVV